jgi:multidrug resistance efflux pump
MCNFAEEARNSLSAVDMELRRMRDWLERDQLGYWTAQIKKRQEDLMQARSDLHRRKLSQSGSEAVSDADQKEALREATRRLHAAEEKLALIRRLIPQLHHAIDEYHSHSQPLGDHIAGGFEKSLAILEKMTIALDAYAALRAPSAPKFDSAQETGPASATATAGGSSNTTTSADDSPAEAKKTDGEASPKTANGSPQAAATPAAGGEPVVSGKPS